MKKSKVILFIISYIELFGTMSFLFPYQKDRCVVASSEANKFIFYKLRNNSIEVETLKNNNKFLIGKIELGSISKIEEFLIQKQQNKTRIIWVESQDEEKSLWVGELRKLKLQSKREIARKNNGVIHSFTFIENKENKNIWVTWIESGQDGDSLVVEEVTTGLKWVIYESELSSIFSPKILIDHNHYVWVFWVSPYLNKRDKLLYSFFDLNTWSDPQPIFLNSDYPQFHPTVSLSSWGFPWAAWTSYDGDDYEIYSSFWNGKEWSYPDKISDNFGFSDGEPYSYLYNGKKLIIWASCGMKNNYILISSFENGIWETPRKVLADQRRFKNPKLITTHNDLWAIWADSTSVNFKNIDIKNLPQVEWEELIINQEGYFLNRESFIAFGDSITYGWLHGEAKDLGYVKRLEELLYNTFMHPKVNNWGVPGEPTWEALGRVLKVISKDLSLYFLLMEGTNDVTTLEYSVNTTAFNLREMLNKCLLYGRFPLISTIIPRGGHRWTEIMKIRTLKLNEFIKEIAGELNIFLVDNFKSFYEYPQGHENLIGDGLHPNENGYQLMASTWYETIKIIPFPPVKITAKIMSRNNYVVLNWQVNNKISPETKLAFYNIYKCQKWGDEFEFTAKVKADSNSYYDHIDNSNQNFIYIIKAENKDKTEGPSSDYITPIQGDPYPPLNTKCELVINKGLFFYEYINRITWQENVKNHELFEISKYRVYRKLKLAPNKDFVLIGEVDNQTYYYLDRGFISSIQANEYEYGVSAVDINQIEGVIGKTSSIPIPVKKNKLFRIFWKRFPFSN